jgi:hypothetical protein
MDLRLLLDLAVTVTAIAVVAVLAVGVLATWRRDAAAEIDWVIRHIPADEPFEGTVPQFDRAARWTEARGHAESSPPRAARPTRT